MFTARTIPILGTAVVLCIGCGQSTAEPTSAGGYVKDVQVTAALGATIEVSSRESVDLAGTRLAIAGGALANDTRVTLQFQQANIITGNAVPAGPVAVWKPSGLTFSTPATLTLPFQLGASQSTQDLIVQVSEGDGSYKTFDHQLLNIDANSHLWTFSITGFSDFQAGIVTPAAACTTDADCGAGNRCFENRCVSGPTPPPRPPLCPR